MHNINNALAGAGLSKIKVSTSVGFDVIADPFPPSSGRFFAHNHNKDVELDATFQQPGTTVVRDSGNGLSYNNLFDAMVDAIHAALEKAGAPDVRVVVSETSFRLPAGSAAQASTTRGDTTRTSLTTSVRARPRNPSRWRRMDGERERERCVNPPDWSSRSDSSSELERGLLWALPPEAAWFLMMEA
ncbi:hypothetical protein PR202_gb24053 [Eleusine coracana subsp. coracana]|uniref:Uncharacterized protein n=1 Tax=Eleusine coracana subsp. coracana TaxID=191504 RepID=A0AAV5FK95_ELECO|nr:hypothetical protein PR202_gb24053 [Eleusine coracana subsp. coracana]